MSSYWSLYIVPDEWTLRDCLTVAYSYHIQALMSDDEFKQFHEFNNLVWTRRYDELVKQPSIYDYTSTNGDPDFDEIMERFPISGRLYEFDKRVYELIPRLKEFVEKYKGKRYICMN